MFPGKVRARGDASPQSSKLQLLSNQVANTMTSAALTARGRPVTGRSGTRGQGVHGGNGLHRRWGAMAHRAPLLLAAAAAATLAPRAEAFRHPGLVRLRGPGGPAAGASRSQGLLPAIPHRPRAVTAVHGLQAQADLVASLASGATSLSGAAVLCGVIAFHEMGHFLAAKVQGIRINDFSIGFGPKVRVCTCECVHI